MCMTQNMGVIFFENRGVWHKMYDTKIATTQTNACILVLKWTQYLWKDNVLIFLFEPQDLTQYGHLLVCKALCKSTPLGHWQKMSASSIFPNLSLSRCVVDGLRGDMLLASITLMAFIFSLIEQRSCWRRMYSSAIGAKGARNFSIWLYCAKRALAWPINCKT